MIETLAELQVLRQQLLRAIAKLADAAESRPADRSALACVRLATECQKLERMVRQLSEEVLKDQHPVGIA